MSSTARPTLSLFVNAEPAAESASATAEGTSSAIVARNSSPACMRALTRLNSCMWCFSPPSRNDAPSMNSVLVTIAPAIDAFTSMYSPARNAVERDDQLGQVAERRVEQAADGVAGLGRDRFGGVAEQRGQRHDRQHRQDEQQRVRFGSKRAATNTTGTKASSQSSGFGGLLSADECTARPRLSGVRAPVAAPSVPSGRPSETADPSSSGAT